MSKTIIIDGNAIGYANHNGPVLTAGGMQTQAIYGFIRSIRHVVSVNYDYDCIVLWDGRAHWRKEIYPEYKENRKAVTEKQVMHSEAYKKQTPFIQKALQALGVKQLHVSSAEADDMAGLLSKKLASGGHEIVLVTTDRDWLQLVSPQVSWYDPVHSRSANVKTFFELTGYKTTEGFLDGKALMGDASDNIAGVGGIGEKGAANIIAGFKSVENFWRQCDAGIFIPKYKMHKRLASEEGREVFRRNKKLMNLLDVPLPNPSDVRVIRPAFSPDNFRTICEELSFMSILKGFDTFVRVFAERLGEKDG